MELIEPLLHIDEYLSIIFDAFGVWTYIILFFVIFAETGFVVTPFLPGDSLLFAAGTFSALGYLNIVGLFVALFVAAVLGDTINYWLGNKLGKKVFKENRRLLNIEHLHKTEKFYAKHGGKAIILARFVPIIRTFAPFVAGVGTMEYGKFISYNVIGGFAWVSLFLFSGYFFGNVPVVQNNFELVIIAIVILSVVPIIYERLKATKSKPTKKAIKKAV